MVKVGRVTILVSGLLALTACDRSSYETRPVTLLTEQGEVVCQLYTADRTYWDKAVVYPDSMERRTADAFCMLEGQKRKEAFDAVEQGQGGGLFQRLIGGGA